MDALFDASAVGAAFAAAEGAIAPLNAGVWVATPSCQVFADVNDVASGRSFTREGGWQQAGQAYRSPNTRAFEIFDFSTFYTRACRVPHIHQ